MEVLKLSETEQQCYGKLFSSCDPENVGYVSWNKASELFIASNLPIDILDKITDLCGVKRVGQFGRSQFYIALRLIAAAQNGHSIELDSFHSGLELPLPAFTKSEDKESRSTDVEQSFSNQNFIGNNQEGVNNVNAYMSQQSTQLPPGAILPPPPGSRSHSRSITSSSQTRTNSVLVNESEGTSILPSNATQVSTNLVGSPSETEVLNSSTPASPKNFNNSGGDQLHDKSWVSYSKSDNQPSWMQFEEHHQLLSNEEESSECQSSDEEDDPFILTDELRKYYTEHFKSLQTDIDGVIPGSAVKQFFEKSGLPNQELSKIWQHSDVDRDGALSLEEFFIAMHLVVLRRNKIELPEKLPSSLLPTSLKKSSNSPNGQSAENFNHLKEKQWTKFNDSPISSAPSPGSKPVNFDFPSAAVEQDPMILHPVPVRLSPEQVISGDGVESIKLRTVSEPIPYKPLQDPSSPTNIRSPKKIIDTVNSGQDSKSSSSQAIQRPIPRKPSAPGPGAILPPPPLPANQTNNEKDENKTPTRNHRSSSYSGPSSTAGPTFHSVPKKEPPPPPPPRPKKNHTRSSSLDLNKLGKTVLGMPPAVPPRISPGISTPKRQISQPNKANSSTDTQNFADFTKFSNVSTSDPLKPQSVENLYERDCEEDECNESVKTSERQRHLSAPLLSERAMVTKDKKDLQAAIKAYRKYNVVLSRLNEELNQELSESMEERIALEIQLERLTPF